MAATPANRLTRFIKRALDVLAALAISALVVMPIVAVLIGLGVLGDVDSRPVDTWLRVDVVEEITMATDEAAGQRMLRTQGPATLQVPGNRAFMISFLVTEILGLIGLVALLKFRALFAALARGDSFQPANSRLLQHAGYALLAWHVIAPPLRFAASRLAIAEAQALPPGIAMYPSFQLSVGGLLTALAVIVLARVLQDASALSQENALTV
jgi:Protein of unknown function (DUF2975)